MSPPFNAVKSVGPQAEDIRLLEALVAPAQPWTARAVSVDPAALEPQDQRLFDDGDLLPGWLYWWLSLAAHLVCKGEQSAVLVLRKPRRLGAPEALFLRTPEYEVLPLTVGDLAYALAQPASRGGIVIAWGVKVSSASLPLTCQGAVMALEDYLGALFAANEAQREALRSWCL